ncbi:MAG: SMC-Scp complex subunit ScpB [Bdellovibrionota bacterium]
MEDNNEIINDNLATEFDESLTAELLTVSTEELAPLIQALIFAYGQPIPFEKIKSACGGIAEEQIKLTIEALQNSFQSAESGIELVAVAGKYQFRTKKIWAEHLKALKESKPRRLSTPALETLAVIAYRQPVVKSDIEKIRGVDPTPTLKTLLDRGFVKIIGHQDTVGQPALYGTTEEFLNIFGLNSLSELPTLRDLKELEVDPGETNEEVSEENANPVPLQEAADLEAAIEETATQAQSA